jgi:DNA gyrase subunit A
VVDYREQARGGKGVIALKRTTKTGDLIALKAVSDVDDLMIITHNGKIIRMHCKDIRAIGRNTQGVRMMRLAEGDFISAVTRVAREESVVDDDNGEEDGNGHGNENGGPEASPDDSQLDMEI